MPAFFIFHIACQVSLASVLIFQSKDLWLALVAILVRREPGLQSFFASTSTSTHPLPLGTDDTRRSPRRLRLTAHEDEDYGWT